ncbi:hypothetical protein BC826DRAFT_972622 [Russula brevipes]|nr:hypothetical protein BC826DRAFT_972622 [Russula brevipes]
MSTPEIDWREVGADDENFNLVQAVGCRVLTQRAPGSGKTWDVPGRVWVSGAGIPLKSHSNLNSIPTHKEKKMAEWGGGRGSYGLLGAGLGRKRGSEPRQARAWLDRCAATAQLSILLDQQKAHFSAGGHDRFEFGGGGLGGASVQQGTRVTTSLAKSDHDTKKSCAEEFLLKFTSKRSLNWVFTGLALRIVRPISYHWLGPKMSIDDEDAEERKMEIRRWQYHYMLFKPLSHWARWMQPSYPSDDDLSICGLPRKIGRNAVAMRVRPPTILAAQIQIQNVQTWLDTVSQLEVPVLLQKCVARDGMYLDERGSRVYSGRQQPLGLGGSGSGLVTPFFGAAPREQSSRVSAQRVSGRSNRFRRTAPNSAELREQPRCERYEPSGSGFNVSTISTIDRQKTWRISSVVRVGYRYSLAAMPLRPVSVVLSLSPKIFPFDFTQSSPSCHLTALHPPIENLSSYSPHAPTIHTPLLFQAISMRVLTQRAHSSWKTRHGMYPDEKGLWRWNSSEEAALGSQSDADTDAQEKMRQNGAGARAVTGYWESWSKAKARTGSSTRSSSARSRRTSTKARFGAGGHARFEVDGGGPGGVVGSRGHKNGADRTRMMMVISLATSSHDTKGGNGDFWPGRDRACLSVWVYLSYTTHSPHYSLVS